MEQPQSWHLSLPIAMLAYNTSYNAAVKDTPFFLFYLRSGNLPYNAILNAKNVWYNVSDYKSEMIARAHRV